MAKLLVLGRYLPPGTGVLRVGDVGGVKGAFYLDTTYNPTNTLRISEFLNEFVSSKGLRKDKVLIYGASKGATGGLYHSLCSGWHLVAVDPIVADEFYETKYQDLHFTGGGLFPRTKEDTFGALLEPARAPELAADQWQRVIVTSSKSPQMKYIDKCLEAAKGTFTIMDSTHPLIVDHPTVARNTLWAHLMVINNILLGYVYPPGKIRIP